MPLHYEVTDIDTIPETLRSEYAEIEENGSKVFRLQLDLPNGIKSALQRERDNVKAADKRARDAEARLQAFDGVDAATLTAEIETLRTQNAESQQRLQAARADSEIERAIAKHKGNGELLPPIIKTMVEMKDGKLVVTGREGVTTVDELIGALAQDNKYAGLFAGSGQSGGGTTGGDTTKGGSRATLSLAGRKRSTMTAGEKARAIRELGGVDEFMKIPY